jgi:hypothetical protein
LSDLRASAIQLSMTAPGRRCQVSGIRG